LVHGIVKDDKGTITKAIGFSKKDHKKRSALLDEKSKSAWTEYQVIKRFNKHSLIRSIFKNWKNSSN